MKKQIALAAGDIEFVIPNGDDLLAATSVFTAIVASARPSLKSRRRLFEMTVHSDPC
jgi:hypothetical protein